MFLVVLFKITLFARLKVGKTNFTKEKSDGYFVVCIVKSSVELYRRLLIYTSRL